MKNNGNQSKDELLEIIQKLDARIIELEKQNEELLRFRSAFKNVPVSMAIQDKELKFTWAFNQQTIDPSKVLNKSDEDIFLPEDAAHLKALKRQVLEKGIEVHEQLWLTSNGKRVFIDLYLQPVYNEQGEVNGVGIATLDLTSLKQTESALKESEIKYQELVKYAPTGIFEIDFRTRKLVSVNDALIMLTGYSKEELLDMNPIDILEDESKSLFESRLEMMVRGDKLSEYSEYKLRAKDGHIIYALLNPTYKINEKGQPFGAVVVGQDITERRMAEEAIRESEMRLLTIMNATTESIWMFSPEGAILHGNPTAYARTGKSEQELNGKYLSELMPPELARIRMERLREVVRTGRPLEFEDERADIFFHHNFYPVKDNSGKVTSVVSFSRDITESKKVEESLRQSEERLNLAQSASGAGVWDWDMATGKLDWSPELFHLFGLEPEKARATFDVWRSLIHPDDLQIAEDRINEAIKEHKQLTSDYRIILSSGQVQWITALGNTQYHPDGKPLRMMGICINISDRKRIEDALMMSEARYRGLVTNINAGVVVHAPDTSIILSNPKAAELLGLNEEQMKGKLSIDPEWKFMSESNDPLPHEKYPVQEILATSQPIVDQILGVHRPANHDNVWLIVNGIPVMDDHGEIMEIIISFIDITERKLNSDTQKFLLQCGLPGSNENFFESLARYIAQHLDMGYVCIDRLDENELVAHTVAVYNDGKFDTNVSYTLKETPCGDVVGKTICCFPENVCSLFPNDAALQDLKAESYIGTTLWSFDRKPIGLIAIIGRERLKNPGMAESMLNQVAIRAAGELERMKAEEKLLHINEELEKRVKERTAQLLITNMALQQSEEKFRTIADFTYDWEYWINAEGSYNYVSPSCKRISGYSAEEFTNDKELIYKIIHPDDLKNFSNHVSHQFQIKAPCETEFRIKTKDGAERWIGHACQPVFGMNGEFLGKRGSNRDITAKVKAEMELINVTTEVEERERNRFARELHDGLGPLLSTVKLYFQWLAETNDTEKIKMITEKGNTNIDLAIRTTHEVAHGLSSQSLNNTGYVHAILEFTQSINLTDKIAINFVYNSVDRFNNFLEMNLFRITTELINNTLRHAGATLIEMKYNFDKEKKLITFTYLDNGIGFDPADLENRTGLGLMNIQQRIKTIWGSMKIESGIGKGMKVSFQLPVKESVR